MVTIRDGPEAYMDSLLIPNVPDAMSDECLAETGEGGCLEGKKMGNASTAHTFSTQAEEPLSKHRCPGSEAFRALGYYRAMQVG